MAAVLAVMTATLDVLHAEVIALATAAREVLPAVVQAGRLPPLQTETMKSLFQYIDLKAYRPLVSKLSSSSLITGGS